MLRTTIYSACSSTPWRFGKDLGLSEPALDALPAAATLHDIDKVTVPKSIISKPGKLTRAEFEVSGLEGPDTYHLGRYGIERAGLVAFTCDRAASFIPTSSVLHPAKANRVVASFSRAC